MIRWLWNLAKTRSPKSPKPKPKPLVTIEQWGGEPNVKERWERLNEALDRLERKYF